MRKIVLFPLIICILAFVGCSSPQNSDADVISSVAWRSLSKSPYDVHVIYGYPGVINTANDPKATYNQIETFLAEAVSYTNSIPKSDNYTEYAGYIGPPYITFSNKSHTITISPAWYVKVTNNTINVEYVAGVLQVTLDKSNVLIQSRSFYNWLKGNKWKTSFHD